MKRNCQTETHNRFNKRHWKAVTLHANKLRDCDEETVKVTERKKDSDPKEIGSGMFQSKNKKFSMGIHATDLLHDSSGKKAYKEDMINSNLNNQLFLASTFLLL